MNPTRTMAAPFALTLGLLILAAASARADSPDRPKSDAALTNADHQVRLPEPEAPAPAPATAQYVAADPYGFASILNGFRAMVGLRGLAYDPSLSSWAVHNNAAQSSRGLGHHVLPNCFQNCGWNAPDAYSAAVMWMNSPAHRDNMLNPGVTRFGIAYGPGPYWTMNAQ